MSGGAMMFVIALGAFVGLVGMIMAHAADGEARDRKVHDERLLEELRQQPWEDDE